MRTTVNLSLAVYRGVCQRAKTRGQSLSGIVAGLTAGAFTRWKEKQERPFDRDERTGAPVVRLGRVTTSGDVAKLWDDE